MLRYSVIVPVYNVEEYLPACLDSVLAQDSPSAYEVILVDDGSLDGSGAICDAYAARDTHFRVIHKKNGGVSAARNTGLWEAKGEYVLYLDSDDFWEPNLMTELDRLLDTRPDMAAFAYYRILETGTPLSFYLPVLPEGESGEAWLKRLFSISVVPCSTPWSYAFRREFLLENQLFFREDLQVSEDFECNMRALPLAKSLVGLNAPLYDYRMRGTSVTAAVSEKKIMDNLVCKVEAFRRFPVAALANLYVSNALLVGHLSKQEAARPVAYLRENRDILQLVNKPPLKLGCLLMTLFGEYPGARIFWSLRSLSRRLRGKA